MEVVVALVVGASRDRIANKTRDRAETRLTMAPLSEDNRRAPAKNTASFYGRLITDLGQSNKRSPGNLINRGSGKQHQDVFVSRSNRLNQR